MADIAPSWIQPVLDDLAERVRANTLPNAVAIAGAQGWGVEWLGAQLAGLCLDLPEQQHEPEQLRELAHPDLRWLEPQSREVKGEEVKGVEVKIDQIRVLTEFAVQTAQMAPRKVAVICEAQTMNEQAANALLKTLEEPPPDTHIILLTHNWGRLMPTVRSRCQRWTIRQDKQAAMHWLQEQALPMDADEFELKGAAPFAIRQTAGQGSSAAFDIRQWVTQLSTKPVAQNVDDAAEMDPADLLTLWYRCIKLHLAGQLQTDLSATARDLHQFSDRLLSVRRQLLTRNSARSGAGLMLEGLLVEWRRISAG